MLAKLNTFALVGIEAVEVEVDVSSGTDGVAHRGAIRQAQYLRGMYWMNEVNRILTADLHGGLQTAEQLLPLIYHELRRLAAVQLANEKPGQTLDATALVHEAYLRLAGNQQFESRGHFFAAVAQAMRRILVDNARRKQSAKRGGEVQRVPLGDPAESDADDQLLALDDALTQLTREDAIAGQIVDMHHFAGLSHEEVARALGTTVYQVRQKWSFARAWLKSYLADS